MACPSCGAFRSPGQRFCGECGTRLAVPEHSPPAPSPEVRLVSVLFCDLVDSTGLAEALDSEDLRAVLSGYFAVARAIVGRFGGIVEKYVGDAVMAVWGATTAHEDDAERAVRAAMELVDAVAGHGDRVGHRLQARVGVATGRAASVDRPMEGLVVGDRVTTAARIQSVAAPGTVLVDEVTRQATTGRVRYVDAGAHALKGKAEPLRLWRALSVARGPRAPGVWAPLVGRAAELRTLSAEFATFVAERRSRLVVVTGPPGVGTSRLLREFRDELAALPAGVLWHSGHCSAYGEGIAFAPLAEMVRDRLGLAWEAPREVARQQLHAGLRTWVTDPAAREVLEPRLGVLLGIAAADVPAQELVAAWWRLLDQVAARGPVVLSFEDVQWAGPDLLDVVEQILDRSAEHPVFALVSGRHELLEARPELLAGRRRVTSLHLRPLPPPDVRLLLDALVPQLSPDVRRRLAAQADGVPLYLVEGVRHLLDRDAAGRHRSGDDVPVPTTLSALLQSRLDALPAPERTLARDLSVLDGGFSRAVAAAVTDLPDDAVDPALDGLLRREVLTSRLDSSGGERYAVAQTLLRTVAYDSLAKRERRRRHLRAAEHLRARLAEDAADLLAAVAVHYRAAWRCAPGEADAESVRRLAAEHFARAGERATAVGAAYAAAQAYRSAAELSADEPEAARLLGLAAAMLDRAGPRADAVLLYEDLLDRHRRAGRTAESLHAACALSHVLVNLGRLGEAEARLEEIRADQGPRVDASGRWVLERARVAVVTGDRESAARLTDRALGLAARETDRALLAEAASLRADALVILERIEEALVVYRWADSLLSVDGDPDERLRVLFRQAYTMQGSDLPGSHEVLDTGVALADRIGNVPMRRACVGLLAELDLWTGRWDAAERRLTAELEPWTTETRETALLRAVLAEKHVLAGAFDAARAEVERLQDLAGSGSGQFQALYAVVTALVMAATDLASAVDQLALVARLVVPRFGLHVDPVRHAWPRAVDGALRLGRLEEAESLLDLVAAAPAGAVPPFLHAQHLRLAARARAARGRRDGVPADLRLAVEELAALGYPYWRALAQGDLAAELRRQGRDDEAEELETAAAATLAELGCAGRPPSDYPDDERPGSG